MSKKTILYVGGFELPDKNAAAHRVINNGKIFRELGYDVVYLGISHTCEAVMEDVFEGFRYWSIPYPKSKKHWLDYLTSIKYVELCAAKIENLEGIIFYNYQAAALAKGLKYCRKHHLWSVVDITEWYVASRENFVFYVIKQMDTFFRMRLLNKKANGLITISTYLTDYYKKNRCKNIIQIPPLVDKNESKWNDGLKEHVSKELQSEKIKLIYAGSTSDMKDNLGIVLKNIADYQELLEFHILGMDEKSFTNVFANYQLKPVKNMIFHGRVTHQECIRWIKACDFQVFLRPDNLVTKAGFPTKLGESFACGTPVITNLTSNISDYLIDGKNGFIVSELTDAELKRVLTYVSGLSSSVRKSMKQYCIETVDFDYKNYISEMTAFVERL